MNTIEIKNLNKKIKGKSYEACFLWLYNKSCGKISQAIFLHKKILPSIM